MQLNVKVGIFQKRRLQVLATDSISKIRQMFSSFSKSSRTIYPPFHQPGIHLRCGKRLFSKTFEISLIFSYRKSICFPYASRKHGRILTPATNSIIPSTQPTTLPTTQPPLPRCLLDNVQPNPKGDQTHHAIHHLFIRSFFFHSMNNPVIHTAIDSSIHYLIAIRPS